MNAISNPPWSTLAKQMRELSLRILSIRDSIGYSKKDARNIVLTNCCIISTSSQLILNMFSSIEKGIIGVKEFESIFDIPKPAQKEANENLEKITRLGLLILFQFQIENFFKNLLRELGVSTKWGFYNICKNLLSSITIDDDKSKLDILNTPASIRNSFHSNGIHYGEEKSIVINGIKYEFINGKMIKCGSWLHILNLLNAVVSILEDILISNEIKSIEETIKDEYIWQRES